MDSLDSIITILATVIAGMITFWTARLIRRGRKYDLREIAGIEALENAVGRAAEMGRPVLYTPGYGGDIQRPTTIASMNILSTVAEKTAEYNCELIYPTHDPIIMATAQEVARESYSRAGKIDRFNPDNIYYVSSSQFGYAAGVEGDIIRKKPASIFLLGTFEAESLILAESGAAVGAMQIAGTDSTIQLSFFLIACDYTLFGEELFAASGYLSGNEATLASVWAQDILRILCALFVVVGIMSALIFPDSSWWKL